MASGKRQRSSNVLDRATCSPSIEECLPQDMLEAVLGKLERETLCTARLVSRTFCAAASANISSLTLKFPSQAVSFERFTRLGYVKVHQTAKSNGLAELDPRLRAIVTHLTVLRGEDVSLGEDASMTLRELPEMPKLRELEVDPDAEVDGAAVLHRLTNLEVLRIGDGTPFVVVTLTAMTWLTALIIGLGFGPGDGWRSADFSWLQDATNLRKLQALQIPISYKALPLIGNLTTLTGLTWLGNQEWDMEDTLTIAPLSRLSRLRSLDIFPPVSASNLAIACSLGSGSLAKLSLWVSRPPSADCGRLLARQTALKRLSVGFKELSNPRHMGALRMELLDSLDLQCLSTVDAEGLDVLQRATSLTKLRIELYFIEQPDVRLNQTLGQLVQLRSLQLSFAGYEDDTTNLNLRLALGPLTALTKLQLYAVRLDNGNMPALLGLTGLQVLHLHRCRLTDDVVPELAVLTNLRTLLLEFCGVTSLSPATNILNPLREARGWPPVNARRVDLAD